MVNMAYSTVDSGPLLQKMFKIALVLALLCMAFFIKEPIIFKSHVYRVFREFSRAQLMWQTRDWQEIQGAHFIVRYREIDDSIAAMVLDLAEKSFDHVSGKFGYIPRGKMPIVIYPTKESLGKSFGWSSDESAMGVYWAGVIRVLSPKAWIDDDDPQVFREIFETEGPVVHELAHLMVDYTTGGNYTRWFTEGIAQYEEMKLTGFEIKNRELESPDQLYRLSEMDRDFDKLPDQNLAYFQSFQAVNYLVSQYGEESIQKIITSLGRGQTLDESFRRHVGVSLDQFEENFRQWMVENY